jgi:hypothetical protein
MRTWRQSSLIVRMWIRIPQNGGQRFMNRRKFAGDKDRRE